jgi:WD40 repeat protein
VIVVKSKERGARTKVTYCAYSPDGGIIAGGLFFAALEMPGVDGTTACEDGALHLWNANSNFVRPSHTIEGAHTKPSQTGSVVFSVDGRTLLTRSSDHTVKRAPRRISLYSNCPDGRTVWDIRAFKKPLAVREDLPALYTNTNAIFSPDDKYVLTGAGSTTKGGKGKLVFMKKENLEVVKELIVNTTPVRVLWHSKINQVHTQKQHVCSLC